MNYGKNILKFNSPTHLHSQSLNDGFQYSHHLSAQQKPAGHTVVI